jgi:heat shock protein HtpX
MFKTFLLLMGLMIFFLFIGRMLAGRKGMAIAFILALVMNGISFWYSDTIVLKAYKAVPAENGHRLQRLTQELAARAGMPAPKVYIIPSKSPNAFATGRSPDRAAVAATEGILDILSDDELRGVMAHELGHVYYRDTLISTVSASVAGSVMFLSRAALFFGGRDDGSRVKTIAVSIIAPVAATIITMTLSRTREYEADEFAARLTKKPESLVSALTKLTMSVKKSPMEDHSPETAHLFIVNPFSGSSLSELFSTHPPMEKRIAKLWQIKIE